MEKFAASRAFCAVGGRDLGLAELSRILDFISKHMFHAFCLNRVTVRALDTKLPRFFMEFCPLATRSFSKRLNASIWLLFDGFPRTIPQAEALVNQKIDIDYVIEIVVPEPAGRSA